MRAVQGKGGTLELSVGPTFGIRWLIPRLGDFLARYPEVTLNVSARTQPYLFAETVFDAAIHAGESPWPGTEAHFLMNEHLITVCSPGLIAPRTSLSGSDWASYRLLHPSTRPYAWRKWFTSCGITFAGDMQGPRYELFSMQIAAAIQGLGIALVPRFLVEPELRTKQLIVVSDHAYISERSYYLIYPERKSENPELLSLRSWLEESVQEYREAELERPKY